MAWGQWSPSVLCPFLVLCVWTLPHPHRLFCPRRCGLARGGQTGGELDALAAVDGAACAAAVKDNPDFVVGVKIRLSTDIAADGANEAAAYKVARDVATATGVPLMTHHTFSSVSLDGPDGCPSSMKPGDIYTHAFHAYPSTIIDGRQVVKAVREARDRGVLFDVGHGQGSFTWTVAELAAASGFFPDTLSTDLHSGNEAGPAYDLVTVMTKFLHIGMALEDVVRAVTSASAAAIGWGDRLGSLAPGRVGDVTVLKLEDTDGVLLEDCQGFQRNVRRVFKPVAVWRASRAYPIKDPAVWPNPAAPGQKDRRDLLVVECS